MYSLDFVGALPDGVRGIESNLKTQLHALKFIEKKAFSGELAGFEYPAANSAIARFEKRLKIDRELQKKKRVAEN